MNELKAKHTAYNLQLGDEAEGMLKSDRKIVKMPKSLINQIDKQEAKKQTIDIIIQNLKKLTLCTLLSSELTAKHTPCEPPAWW